MKNKLSILASFLFFTVNCFAQISLPDSALKANELVKIEQKLMDGVAIGDSALWKQYLSKDFMIVNEDGSRTFYREFVEGMKPLPKGVSGHIVVKEPRVCFMAGIAVLNYVADEYENYMGNRLHTSYGTMEVYQHKNDKWVLTNSEVFEIPQLPIAIDVPIAILKQYQGTYKLTPDISCRIILENSHLWLKKNNRKKEELFAETASVFFRRADSRGRKLFTKDNKGKWLMRERRNGQDIIWRKYVTNRG
jgi:hypothetical protein